MKFAKQLDREQIPEWRVKYLNYKAGKKHVKSVERAFRNANASPGIHRRSADLPPCATPSFPITPRRTTEAAAADAQARAQARAAAAATAVASERNATKGNHPCVKPKPSNASTEGAHHGAEASSSSSSRPVPRPAAPKTIPREVGTAGEKQRLTDSPGSEMQYGSFVASPPPSSSPPHHEPGPHNHSGGRGRLHATFQLPSPALTTTPSYTEEPLSKKPTLQNPSGRRLQRSLSIQAAAAGQGRIGSGTESPRQNAAPRHAPTSPGVGDHGSGDDYHDTPRQRLMRIFSTSSPLVRKQSRIAMAMHYQDEIRQREDEFFAFLDSELEKVDTFYREKEAQAQERLKMLKEQLHVMRNRRNQEVAEILRRRRAEATHGHNISPSSNGGTHHYSHHHRHHDHYRENGDDKHWTGKKNGGAKGWVDPLKTKLLHHPSPNSQALQHMAQTPHLLSMSATTAREQDNDEDNPSTGPTGTQVDARKDYIRRPNDRDVPYRTAKHKLKLALQEFYRGLELLKSYALLNRTAFRKLNKKYDKAVNARPPNRYMNERVNRAYFVTSEQLELYISAVEDLYARYFERGKHKIAAAKLRSLSRKAGDESASAFRSGLLIGVGCVFAFQGLTYGAGLLLDRDPTVAQQASYLMQIYAGYFLMLYLFSLFCLDCRIWTRNKINYQFIFEFDPRSQLDWRQLSEFPSFFFLVFGVFMWINFSRMGAPQMYLYYPVILIGVTAIVLFFPAPILFYKSRRWFLYSHWRLLLAGIYPVEFRDFFLGDIYCSLTYAMCNIELFFCLYRRSWLDPEQCNSSHSRLLGFLSTLPPIWRALQCIRRYRDTKNVFPHLVNCGKYTMTILATICLSLYRIDNTKTNLAMFITFSTIATVYCSIWDLFMDFSLLQSSEANFLLRDIIALKQRWPYYVVMVVDPILRFAWVFYAIFTYDTQHSTIVSFFIAFAEVSRRGMWTIFRVENEHCANVAQYKASRDVPLPYHLETFTKRPATATGVSTAHPPSDDDGAATAAAEAAPSSAITGGRSTGIYLQERAPTSSATAAEEGRANIGAAAVDDGGMGSPLRPTLSQRLGRCDTAGTIRRRGRADTIMGDISRIMAEAHRQDFEKRRKPADEEEAEEGLMGAIRSRSNSGVASGTTTAVASPTSGRGYRRHLRRGMSDDDDEEDEVDEEEALYSSDDDHKRGTGSGTGGGGGRALDSAQHSTQPISTATRAQTREPGEVLEEVLEEIEMREAEELGPTGGPP